MNPIFTSEESCEPDYQVSYREFSLSGPTFEVSDRAKHTTRSRHAHRRGKTASSNGVHRRRQKRNYL